MSPTRGREGRMEARKKAGGADLRRDARERKAVEREAARAAKEAIESAGWSEDGEFGEDSGNVTGRGKSKGEAAIAGGELVVGAAEDGWRLDHFLVARLGGVSRARVQLLIEQGKVKVGAAESAAEESDGKQKSKGAEESESIRKSKGKDKDAEESGDEDSADSVAGAGAVVERASRRLSRGERVRVTGAAKRAPLRAVAEDIPLEIVYEDADLAIVNKPAGMLVHAGAGSVAEDERGKGTLVNALLHHLGNLSQPEDELRPGIVHRLDKGTSGLLVVAKNDAAHAKLAAAFAERETEKVYVALVQGRMPGEKGTINAAVSRDLVRRTRMTTRRSGGRSAVTHWKVLERIETAAGEFTLLEVTIETGRTHQIRVHLSSVGHPVVGDTLYGAAGEIVAAMPEGLKTGTTNTGVRTGANKTRGIGKAAAGSTSKFKKLGSRAVSERMASVLRPPSEEAMQAESESGERLKLERNFLHARRLGLAHPRSGEWMEWEAELPEELESFIARLRRVK